MSLFSTIRLVAVLIQSPSKVICVPTKKHAQYSPVIDIVKNATEFACIHDRFMMRTECMLVRLL